MKSKFTVNFSLVALALSNIIVFTSVVEARPSVGSGGSTPITSPNKVTPAPKLNSSVNCENLSTVARQGSATAILISWNTTEFGPEYTPANRCNTVSTKLNALIQGNGGKFSNLRLTNGPVNGRIVICALKPSEVECNSNNQLFTLKRENERFSGRVLGQLLNIGNVGSGTINEDSGEQVIVDLGQWANRNLRESQETGVQEQNVEPAIEPAPSSDGGFK
jgi:hypothetical protein